MSLKSCIAKSGDQPGYLNIYVGNQKIGYAYLHEFSFVQDLYTFHSFLNIVQSESSPKGLIWIYKHVEEQLNSFLNRISTNE